MLPGISDQNFDKGGPAVKLIRRTLLALSIAFALSAGVAAEMFAFNFDDWDAVDYQPQVARLTSLGLFGGYQDNTFRPDNCITRAETAKLISCLQVDTVPQYTTFRFTDTTNSWARDYIEYCAQKGILSGYNGQFRPNDYVTIQELAKVLLVVLGQDSSRYVGSQWAQMVETDAQAMGILDGYIGERNQYATRQQACLLIGNALQCPVLVEQKEGETAYVLDSMMTPMSLLQYRFNVIPVVGVVEANAQVDLRDNTPLEGNLIHIAGYSKDFLVTEEVANDVSLLGHTVMVYAQFFTDQNRVYGLPTLRDTGYIGEDLRPVELALIMEYGQMTVSTATSVYLNYTPADCSILDTLQLEDRITIFDYQQDGRIDCVLVSRPISDPSPEESEDATTAQS